MFSQSKKDHRIAYSQNFLNNQNLAKKLVNKADFSDIKQVYEIGPGKGILSKELALKKIPLSLIEKDKALIPHLQKKFEKNNSVTIIQNDFLKTDFDYSNSLIFSNPPFNITSQILKHLVLQQTIPKRIYLFMQTDAYNRFKGNKKTSLLSAYLNSIYKINSIYNFAPTDFTPVPSIDINLAYFELFPSSFAKEASKRLEFWQFLVYAFSSQKESAYKQLKTIFTHEQWKRLAKQHKFDYHIPIIQLTSDQLKQIYLYYIAGVSNEKKEIVKKVGS